ncbi:hypothetical protein QQP08_017869 [Theobroma cacao]|nr:hypothetical protein QQP08_017869 [Theobroma cacao]
MFYYLSLCIYERKTLRLKPKSKLMSPPHPTIGMRCSPFLSLTMWQAIEKFYIYGRIRYGAWHGFECISCDWILICLLLEKIADNYWN